MEGESKRKNGKGEVSKSSWTHFTDDPHDSWSKEAFEATLKNDSGEKLEPTAANAVPETNLNKPVEKVKEGDVSSVTSKKVIYGAARSSLLKSQDKAIEVAEKRGDLIRKQEPDTEPKENIVKKSVEALKNDKEEWRNARDLANKLETEYKQKYEAHVLKESKRWQTLGRRMWGLQPQLSDELLTLRNQADAAQASFHTTAKKIFNLRDNQVAERYTRRLLPKAAAVMPYVHQERLRVQERAANEAWGDSKYLRPTLETLAKHKYTLAGMSMGVAVISGAGVIPVLAAMGAGLVAGKGTLEGLNNTYVNFSRKKLAQARENIGASYIERSFTDLNADLEHLTFNVGAREKRAKVVAAGVGVAAGIGTGVGTRMYLNGLEASVAPVDVTKPDSPYTPSPVPHGDGQVPPIGEVPVKPDIPPNNAEVMPDVNSDKTPVPPKEMGDLRVMEESQALIDKKGSIKFSEIPDPKLNGVPPDLEVVPKIESTPEVVPENPTPSQPEVAPETMDVTHKVVKGDNVWNIMEGKGSDANPVGGKSEVLKGMTLADRQAALDQLVDYAEKHPEFAKEVGALKSGGDIHRIYPGEEINVSALDDKLRELLGIESKVDASAIDNPQAPSEVPNDNVPEDIEQHEPEDSEIASINEMKVSEVVNLQKSVLAGDTAAIERMNSLDLDKDSLQELVNTIFDRGTGDVNGDLTVREYLNDFKFDTDINKLTLKEIVDLTADVAQNDSAGLARLEALGMTAADLKDVIETAGLAELKDTPYLDLTLEEWMKNPQRVLEYAPDTETPDATPYGLGKSVPESDTIVRDANAAIPETGGQSIAKYIRDIEQPKTGFIESLFGMGQPNISGSFEQMKDLSVGEVREMVANDDLPEGVSEAGFDRWVGELKKVTADNNERFADVITRAANSRVS